MITVKQIKDDAIIQVPVSKGYYLGVKQAVLHLLNKMLENKPNEEYLAAIGTKELNDLDDDQKTVKIFTLLIAEIEAQAKIQNQFVEDTVLEPGDEGYVAPVIAD